MIIEVEMPFDSNQLATVIINPYFFNLISDDMDQCLCSQKCLN